MTAKPASSGDEVVTSGVVYTDGAARGNPGPAGAGAFFKIGDRTMGFQKYLGRATNNQAEYQALLLALEKAEGLGIKELRAFADSELMVKQIKGEYRVKNEGLKPLFREAKERIQAFDSFEISHVRREKNTEADRLANAAIDDYKR